VTTTIDGDTTQQTIVRVFASSDDVNTTDIETWTESNSTNTLTNFQDLRNISISQSGRIVTVTGEADATEFFEEESGT
jgi:hypothetical protein